MARKPTVNKRILGTYVIWDRHLKNVGFFRIGLFVWYPDYSVVAAGKIPLRRQDWSSGRQPSFFLSLSWSCCLSEQCLSCFWSTSQRWSKIVCISSMAKYMNPQICFVFSFTEIRRTTKRLLSMGQICDFVSLILYISSWKQGWYSHMSKLFFDVPLEYPFQLLS